MSDNTYSIQEVGGVELARHYPDCGPIRDSNCHNAILKVETRAEGWLSWLESLARGAQSFLAVVSANGTGLRVSILLDQFSIFIPWSEASVSATRGWPASVVRLRTAATPSLTLVFHLDDAAADDLMRDVVQQLPTRHPPRQLAWWMAESWMAWVVLVTGVRAGLIMWFLLPKR